MFFRNFSTGFIGLIALSAAGCAKAPQTESGRWVQKAPASAAETGYIVETTDRQAIEKLLEDNKATGRVLDAQDGRYEVFGLDTATISAALPEARFDIVTLWDVIEHVPDPVPLLAEAARVLRPGGRLVLTTGDWGSAYARRQGAQWHLVAPPWHLTLFDRRTLESAGRRAGLRRLHCASEGVAGDGRFWRHRAGLLLGRLLDRGDIMRMTFTR